MSDADGIDETDRAAVRGAVDALPRCIQSIKGGTCRDPAVTLSTLPLFPGRFCAEHARVHMRTSAASFWTPLP